MALVLNSLVQDLNLRVFEEPFLANPHADTGLLRVRSDIRV